MKQKLMVFDFVLIVKILFFYTTTPAELRLAAERKFCVYIVPNSSASVAKAKQPTRQFNVSRERIRNIDAKALRSIKGPTVGVPIIKLINYLTSKDL